MLSVFSILGFLRITEADSEFVYYLHHSIISSMEVFVDKKDSVNSELVEDQLVDIGLKEEFFDSIYEYVNQQSK